MDDSIQNALIKFENKEVSHLEMAAYIGFTDEELDMVILFWEPCFNRAWMYLAREKIKEWFCANDITKRAVNNFHNQVLFKYEKKTEYKAIDQYDSLIKSFYTRSLNLRTEQKSPVFANGTKFYAVTGECFKMICMERNKKVRRYYIKVENLAIFMMKYIHAVQTKELESQKQLLLESNAALLEKNRIIQACAFQMTVFNTIVKVDMNAEDLYIFTKKTYAQDNKFKISSCISGESFNRIKSHNSVGLPDELYYITFIRICPKAKSVRKIIYDCFKQRDGWLHFPYESLKKIVNHAIDNTDDIVTHYNYIMDDFNQSVTKGMIKTIVPPEIKPQYYKLLDSITTNDIEDFILETLIEYFHENEDPLLPSDFNTIVENFEKKIKNKQQFKRIHVKWKDLRVILESILKNNRYIITRSTFKTSIWRKSLSNNYGTIIIVK